VVFGGVSTWGWAQQADSVLPGSHQSGPAFVLISTGRPSSLFVCLFPALHLMGLGHCKMRKNGSGIIVEIRRSGTLLCTSSLAGREKGN